MQDLIAALIVGLLAIGLLLVLMNLANFIYETIRMIINKNYKRKYDIGGKSIDYRIFGADYINFWGKRINPFKKHLDDQEKL